MYIDYNSNPTKNRREDCIIRAMTKALDISWDEAYMLLAVKGFEVKEMPSINWVWSAVLKDQGFERMTIPNTCPDCYTVSDFCRDNPKGAFILATGSHVIAVIDGDYFDTWDSGAEVPLFYFKDTEEWVTEPAKKTDKPAEGGKQNGK